MEKHLLDGGGRRSLRSRLAHRPAASNSGDRWLEEMLAEDRMAGGLEPRSAGAGYRSGP